MFSSQRGLSSKRKKSAPMPPAPEMEEGETCSMSELRGRPAKAIVETQQAPRPARQQQQQQQQTHHQPERVVSQLLPVSRREQTTSSPESQDRIRPTLTFALDTQTHAKAIQSRSTVAQYSAEVRQDLVPRTGPQMSDITNSGDFGTQGELSLSDIGRVPHSTARLPAKVINVPFPPPHPLPAPNPAPAPAKRRALSPADSPKPKRPKRKSREGKAVTWNGGNSSSSEEEIEDDEMPPSSGQRMQLATQSDVREEEGVTPTPDLSQPEEDSMDVDEGDSRTVDMSIDAPTPAIVPPRPLSSPERRRLGNQARAGLPASRILSRASTKMVDEEEDPTQQIEQATQESDSVVPDSESAGTQHAPATSTPDASVDSSLPGVDQLHYEASQAFTQRQRSATVFRAELTSEPEVEPPIENAGQSEALEQEGPVEEPEGVVEEEVVEAEATQEEVAEEAQVAEEEKTNYSAVPTQPKRKGGRGRPPAKRPVASKAKSEAPKSKRTTPVEPIASTSKLNTSRSRRVIDQETQAAYVAVPVAMTKPSKKPKQPMPPPPAPTSKKGKGVDRPGPQRTTSGFDLAYPYNYVLALYRGNVNPYCFYPVSIVECRAHGLLVRSADGNTFPVSYADVRRCELRTGDQIEWWGEGADGSLSTITRVEDEATGQDLTEGTTASAKDSVACARAGVWDRFYVEAICYPTRPKMLLEQLDDRKLTKEEIEAYKSLAVPSKSRSTSLAPRASSVVPRAVSTAPISSTLFEGCGFFVTMLGNADGPASPKRRTSSTSVDRTSLPEKLASGGGEVFQTMGDMYEVDEDEGKFTVAARVHDHLFLLAAQTVSTPKYLLALALGVPCISMAWVAACSEADERVDWRPFLLSASSTGLGVQLDVLKHDSTSAKALTKRKRSLLKGMRVLCLSATQSSLVSFGEATRHLLSALGANRVRVFAFSKNVPKAEVGDASMIVLEDITQDNLAHEHVVSFQHVKDCVFAGRMI